MASYNFTTEIRAGASASETRAASEVPGFEPGRTEDKQSNLTTAPLRPVTSVYCCLTHTGQKEMAEFGLTMTTRASAEGSSSDEKGSN